MDQLSVQLIFGFRHLSKKVEMSFANCRKSVLIALVICYVTPTYQSNAKSARIKSLDGTLNPTETIKDVLSEESLSSKGPKAGTNNLKIKQVDGSNPPNVYILGGEEDNKDHVSSDSNWNGHFAHLKENTDQFHQVDSKLKRAKRDAQEIEKRLSYDRMGKRLSYDRMGKRFSDTMRLGKREPTEELDQVKRFADAMRLGKRVPMDSMRLGKRLDAMRLGKRLDAMRLGRRAAMDTMRLGKRMDEMRFGKRMDQMRLGKRNFNSFMQDDSLMHSISNGKRMGDVMRLGKRSEGATELSLSDAERDELMRNLDDQESDEDFFEIKKKMSDLMRLGKRDEDAAEPQTKRMSDLMRLGKRLAYDRVGKRHFMDDETRFGKRMMDEMRMGKRMGDVMRLGKRAPDAMRLGKRVPYYIPGMGLIDDDDFKGSK